MPRLFTGLALPDAVARELATMRGGLPGARWIDAEDYHLTLRFIGDIDEAVAYEVYDILGTVRRPAFKMALSGLDAFGGSRPRAIIAIAKPAPALLELQAEHERLLRRLGIPPETRKFVPHVTLARLRKTSPPDVAFYLSMRGWLASREFEVDSFILFSARDSTGGGPYVTEAVYPLR